MIVLVTGTHVRTDRVVKAMVGVQLDDLHKHYTIEAVVHGGAPGVDTFAGAWARAHGVCEVRINAQWGYHGKKAGPIRNGWMLAFTKPTFVLALPDPRSVGTWDMVRRAKTAGIDIRLIEVKEAQT